MIAKIQEERRNLQSQLQTVKEIKQELELKIQLLEDKSTETTPKEKEPSKNNKKPEPKEKSTIEEQFKEIAGYKVQEQEKNTLEPSIELTRHGREGLPPTRKRIRAKTRKDSETTMHEQNCLACGSRHHKIKECQQKMNIYVKS